MLFVNGKDFITNKHPDHVIKIDKNILFYNNIQI